MATKRTKKKTELEKAQDEARKAKEALAKFERDVYFPADDKRLELQKKRTTTHGHAHNLAQQAKRSAQS